MPIHPGLRMASARRVSPGVSGRSEGPCAPGSTSVHVYSSLRVLSCRQRLTSSYFRAIGGMLLQPRRAVLSHGNRAVVPGLVLATGDWASWVRRKTGVGNVTYLGDLG